MKSVHRRTKVIDFRDDDFIEKINQLGIRDDFLLIAAMEVQSPSRVVLGELFLNDEFELEDPGINGRLVPEVLDNLTKIVSNLKAVRFYVGQEHYSVQTPSKEEIQLKVDEINRHYDCLGSEKIQRWLYENNSDYRGKIISAQAVTEQIFQTVYVSNLEFTDLQATAADYLQIPKTDSPIQITKAKEDKVYVGLLLHGNKVEWKKTEHSKKELQDKLDREYREWWRIHKDKADLCNRIIVPLDIQQDQTFIAISHYAFPGFGGNFKSGRVRFNVCSSFLEGMLSKDYLQKQNKLRNSSQIEFFILLDGNLDIVYTLGLNDRYCQKCEEFHYPLPEHFLLNDGQGKYNTFIRQRHISVEVGFLNKTKYLFDEFDCPDCGEGMKKVYQVFQSPSKTKGHPTLDEDEHEMDDYLSMEAKMEAEERSSQHELEWVTEQDQSIFERSPIDEDW
ncbi:hypothetical protein [Virgibacillus senegalensis]|uniref:hypothetical protein n=1 Tax=Virgibacillus senegalensis TaxID=1499679 RepID=UPI00069F8CD2|nr:hypothetical protein [Virgibacillus senegalensis]